MEGVVSDIVISPRDLDITLICFSAPVCFRVYLVSFSNSPSFSKCVFTIVLAYWDGTGLFFT